MNPLLRAGRTIINGPFAETKELIAGFWIWKVKSMDEAVAWLKRCPNPHDEDFAPCDPTGELRAAEAHLREQIEKRS
jgi:hypothetical protein